MDTINKSKLQDNNIHFKKKGRGKKVLIVFKYLNDFSGTKCLTDSGNGLTEGLKHS